jgi:hypothetical protein
MVKKILLAVVAVLVVAQFIRSHRNISPAKPGPDDFLEKFAAPADVRQKFTAACYDCHSNNTRYPWYANIQPVGWWLQYHVNEGRDHLNLSEFGRLTAKRQGQKIDNMTDELTDRTMPLGSYTLVHHDARLSDAEVKRLLDWLGVVRDKLPEPEGN